MNALRLAVVVMCAAVPIFAQNSALAPQVHPTFFNASGTVAGNGFLCTTQTGTNTSLLTYQDSALTTPNQNPIRLNAVGRAVNGGNEVSIFIQNQKYRFSLYAAGTGNTCNGTTVGALINQADNVYDLALLQTASFATLFDDQICHASQETGTSPNDMGGKIAACITALPAAGGIVDARGLQGAQTVSATVTTSKQVTILLGQSTITCTVGTASGCLSLSGAGSAVEGQGQGNTILVMSNANGVGFLVTGNYSRIEHMTIRGGCTVACAVTGNGIGVNSGSTTGVYLNDLTIERWNSIAIDTGGSAVAWIITNSTVQDIYGDGVFLAGGSGHTVYGITCNHVGSNCIDINASTSVVHDIVCSNVGAIQGGIDTNCVLISSIVGNTDGNDIYAIRASTTTGSAVRIRADASGSASRNHVHHSFSNGHSNGYTVDTSIGGTCGTANNNLFDHNVAMGGTGSTLADFGVNGGTTPCIANGNIFDANVSLSTVEGYGVAVTWGTGNKIVNTTILGPPATANYLTSGSAGTTVVGGETAASVAGAGFYVNTPCIGVKLDTGCYGSLDLASGSAATDGLFFGDRTNGWLITEDGSANMQMRSTSSGTPNAYQLLIPRANTGIITPSGIIIGASGSGHYIPIVLGGSTSLTFNSGSALAANTCYTANVTVTGAAASFPSFISVPAGWQSLNVSIGSYSTTNAVIVNICNVTTGTIANPGALTFNAYAFQF